MCDYAWICPQTEGNILCEVLGTDLQECWKIRGGGGDASDMNCDTPMLTLILVVFNQAFLLHTVQRPTVRWFGTSELVTNFDNLCVAERTEHKSKF
jgi:hypothetical protein